MIDANETRVHARLIASRETLLLFTPTDKINSASPILLAAVFANGAAAEPLASPLTMLPPNSSTLQRRLLEQDLTSAEHLPPYSEHAWATVRSRAAYCVAGARPETLIELAAPSYRK